VGPEVRATKELEVIERLPSFIVMLVIDSMKRVCSIPTFMIDLDSALEL
jgi:hypothetical protein